MKKLLSVTILIASGILLSGCNTNGGELFTQALNSSIPAIGGNGTEIVSEAPIKIISIEGYGRVLATKKTMPLYTKSGDSSTESTCYDECAIAWPPLTVRDTDDVSGDYGILERTDGTLQVTRLGMPLYGYTPDKARKVSGDGYKGVWSVVVVEKEVEVEIETE